MKSFRADMAAGNDFPALVVGGLNMDLIAAPFKPLLLRDSNPGRVTMRPGGVGRNIACGMAQLGMQVELVSAIGEDAFAPALLESLAQDGVGAAHVLRFSTGSGAYFCLHDFGGDMLCAVNQMDAVERLTPERLSFLPPLLSRAPVAVLDANLPEGTLRFLAECAPARLVADPVSAAKAGRLLPILPRLCAIKPNRLEAEALTGEDCGTDAGLRRAAEFLLLRGVQRVYISLGAQGLYYADARGEGTLPSLLSLGEIAAGDFTGAGDAMTAALAYAESQGFPAQTCACAGLLASAARVTGTLSPALLASLG